MAGFRADERTVETDVLVIGGGIAGVWAAIRARQLGARVMLASKATAGRSGCSVMVAGTWSTFDPKLDDLDGCTRDALETSDYLDDPAMARIVYQGSRERQRDMEAFGVPWIREADGRLFRRPGLGMKVANNAMFESGLPTMWIMRSQAARMGVEILDRTMATGLLTSDGQQPTRGSVVGAVGFHVRQGTFHVLRARVVVMASGDWGLKSEYHPSDATGDGQWMAYQAGAQLRCMDQLGYSLVAKFGHVSGLHAMLGHGAHLANQRGERFMERYSPDLKERSSRAVLVRGVANELRSGRGPIFMDCTHLPAPDILRLKAVIPRYVRIMASAGLDIARDRIPFTLALYGNGPAGGLKVDHHCRTNVPGLMAAGGAGDRIGYAGLNGFTGAAVQGYLAGESAAQYALGSDLGPVHGDQKAWLFQDVCRHVGDDGRSLGEGTSQALLKLQTLVDREVGVFKTEASLRAAQRHLAELLGEELAGLVAPDPHDLKNIVELRNMAELARLMAAASAVRTESRYFNFREDYPEMDDQHWRKWIITQRASEGDEVEMWTEDIPAFQAGPSA